MYMRRHKLGRSAALALNAAVLMTLIAACSGDPSAPVTPVTPPIIPAGSSPAPTALVWGPTGVIGAGFVNVVALPPGDSRTVIAGADVAGFQRSTNAGASFAPSNIGVPRSELRAVAALLVHPTRKGVVYAAAGNGTVGAVLVSGDGGATWTLRSERPVFHGGNSFGLTGEPSEHPRSTGNLLALDIDPSGRESLYAATFADGVMRSTDDGATWTTIGLAPDAGGPHYLRGLALVRSGADVAVYAASHGRGVWKWTSASSRFVALEGSPRFPEEIASVAGTLYVAGGANGVFSSADGGATWTARNAGLSTAGPVWLSIAGYVAGSQTVLYAGCAFPAQGVSLVRSDDGGVTWRAVMQADAPSIHYEVGGPGGEQYWLLRSTKPSDLYMMPGHSGYVPAQIAVDPATPQTVWLAGRSGLWRTTDEGQNWYPMVGSLGVTVNNAVVVDPRSPARVYVGNTDWTLIASTDGLAHIVRSKGTGAESKGFDLALDSAGGTGIPAGAASTLSVAVGDRDNNIGGEVYSNATPESPDRWTNEALAQAAGGNRPLAVTVGNAAGQRVLIAAVEEAGTQGRAGSGGVYRKVGNGGWQRIATPAMTQAQRAPQASLEWAGGGAPVYLYDHVTGVWRSMDAGATWALIWAKPTTAPRTGFLALDPLHKDRLFVSANDGVYQLDSADHGSAVGNGIVSTRLEGLATPGVIAVDPYTDRLYAAGLPPIGAQPRLAAWDAAARIWVDLADDYYRATLGNATGIAIAPGSRVYVSLPGNGVVVGAPAR